MKKLFTLHTRDFILYAVALIVGVYLLFSGVISTQPVLAPLVTAVILSLVILPLNKRLEKVMHRSLASILSTLVLVLVSIGIIFLVFLQIKNFTDSWPKIEKSMKPKIEKFQNFAIENTPLTKSDFDEFKSQIKTSESGISVKETGKTVTGMVMKVFGFIGNYLLTFIYIFFMLRYRTKFYTFLVGITKKEKQDNIKTILRKSSEVSTQYLVGKAILIGLLSAVYSIGLGISGVSNFILISIIAAILTLIPYIGNIIGFSIAMVFGYLTTGDPLTLLGIVITFVVSQFLESYILQPFVVGDKVNVHPFFVIVAVIFGNFIWGIIGMVLAIPVLAIIMVILKHIPKLKPIGILLSTDSFDS